MQGAIHRRTGARENAADPERVVIVLDKAHRTGAMPEYQLVAQSIALLAGDIRTDDRVVQIIERLSVGEAELTVAAMAKMGEVIRAGAEHRITAVRITQGNRDRPIHPRMGGDFLETLPGHGAGRIADAKYRIQQQLHRTGTRTDDQVGAGNGSGKAGAGFGTNLLHPQ